MKCLHCGERKTSVTQTTRPIDEGLPYGHVKRRLRKCRSCERSFTTFEIHEPLFRKIRPKKDGLGRQPLIVDDKKEPLTPKVLGPNKPKLPHK